MSRRWTRHGLPSVVCAGLLGVGLAGCSGQLPLHNPKPSPYGHGDRGALIVEAGRSVCWRLYVQQQKGVDRLTGCGNHRVAMRRYGFFVVFVTKTDSTRGVLKATVTSGGKIIQSRSTTVPNAELQLIG